MPLNFSTETEKDNFFMREAIKEAKKSPKSIKVGAIIVKDGKIISKGHSEGEFHAEFTAIKEMKHETLKDQENLAIYTTMQPCIQRSENRKHLPNCTNLICDKKISEVIFGCIDPFVASRGNELFQKNKVTARQIKDDKLLQECKELAKPYFDKIAQEIRDNSSFKISSSPLRSFTVFLITP